MTTKPAGYVYVVIFSGGEQPGSILITPIWQDQRAADE
jgi:hypothetical protein